MAGFLTNVGHVFSTVGHDMVEGVGKPAPQYQVDPETGTMNAVQGEATPGTMFKNLLVGALTGLAAGSQVRGGFGAQVGAGFQAAQDRNIQQDQLARANAQQQFTDQQAAQRDMDAHTLNKAQMAALQQKTMQDAVLFNQAQKKNDLDIGKLEQGMADSYNANLMAGAKPFQHMGEEVPAFDSLDQAEQFANTHPEDVVAGFTTQIHRTPEGKWQITQLPTQEQEYTFNIGGKEIKQRMTPAQAQTVYNAQLAAKKTNADIAETNARTGLVNSQRKQVEQNMAASPVSDSLGVQITPPAGGIKEQNKIRDSFKKDADNLAKTEGTYNQFTDVLNDINSGKGVNGAQSVVALFNAIGISAEPLQGKGFRINNNTVEEHANARGLGDTLYQKLLKLKNGDVITPQQIKDYAGIALRSRHDAYVNKINEVRSQGVDPTFLLPRGNGRNIDSNTAQIFLDAAEGNPDNAMKKAKELGWK